MNDFLSKAKSLKPNPDPKFAARLLKLVDQITSKQISIIKNGIPDRDSKTSFLLKKIKQYSLEVSADDKTSTVENFTKDIEDSLMAVIQSPDCNEMLSEIKLLKYKEWNERGTVYMRNFLEELNISDLFVLSDCSDYLDKIYEKDKLFQTNLFKKVVAITRLFYAYLILDQLLKLRKKIEKDSNDTSIWIDAYKIGLLQGNLGLIESFLDPAIKDIQHQSKSGEASKRQWDEARKAKEQEEKPIVDEIKKIAEEIWGIKKETILHDQMTEYIYGRLVKKYPERYGLRELILRTVRPVAKKYNYLRGGSRPEFSGTVEEVDVVKRHVVVKNKEGEKTFYVKKTSEITKGVKKIQLADLKKGMNVSVKYRNEKGKMVTGMINVTGPLRLLRKNV